VLTCIILWIEDGYTVTIGGERISVPYWCWALQRQIGWGAEALARLGHAWPWAWFKIRRRKWQQKHFYGSTGIWAQHGPAFIKRGRQARQVSRIASLAVLRCLPCVAGRVQILEETNASCAPCPSNSFCSAQYLRAFPGRASRWIPLNPRWIGRGWQATCWAQTTSAVCITAPTPWLAQEDATIPEWSNRDQMSHHESPMFRRLHNYTQ
jgi:hypothetical protein